VNHLINFQEEEAAFHLGMRYLLFLYQLPGSFAEKYEILL
jgi:hypothetical protein